jgi:two-component system, cell cycle response regulator
MAEQQIHKKILIADDDPVSRRLLETSLAKWGYDVTVAVDGTSALRILDGADAPRLAILDWMMPGVEGVKICQLIRERTDRHYIYLILLTGRSEKEDLLQGLRLGADDYLSKPFDLQELRARLHVGERILKLQNHLIGAKEELRFRATHDSVTGIFNRAVALDEMEREHARQIREGGPFGVILADLDHFKAINDTYGHLAGDAVLRETARRMLRCVRSYDTVGRFGGEEFLIIAVRADERITLLLAERMRKNIEAAPFVTDAGDIRVTACFGAAVGLDASKVPAKTLLQRADEALYRAKRQGRNRCEISPSPVLAGSGVGK